MTENPKGPPPLRGFREAAGVSLNELSHLAQVPASTLSRIERGLTPGSPVVQFRIARALGIGLKRLFPKDNPSE